MGVEVGFALFGSEAAFVDPIREISRLITESN